MCSRNNKRQLGCIEAYRPMEDVPDPRGLDINVRQSGLDMIKSMLSECVRRYYSNLVVRDIINSIAIKCEQRIFEDAKSKEEYHLKIQEKLENAGSKMQSNLFTSASGNSRQRTMTPRLVNSAPPQQRSVWSCLEQSQNMVLNHQQPSWNQFPAPSPTMQPGIGAVGTSLNQPHQNQAFGQPNVMQTNTRYQAYLRNRATRERIMNFDRHRETLAEISRLENAQRPQQPCYPLVTSQQHQINQQFQDTRLLGHQMLSPSPYVAFPSLAANNNQFPQSLNTNAIGTSVMPTFHAVGAADPEWQYLIKQLESARLTYLLQFKTWLQMFDQLRPLVQTMKHKDVVNIHTLRLQEMIKILTAPINSLIGFCSKERMCEYLKQFVEYHNYMTQKIAANSGNKAQAQPFSSPYNQAIAGGSQRMQSVPAPMNTSFSYPQLVDASTLGRGSVFGLERGTADHNVHHNMNQNQQYYQTTCRNNFMDLSSEQQINPTSKLADKGKQPMDSMWQPGSFNPILEPQGNRNQVMDSALAPLSPPTQVTPMSSQKQSHKCSGKSPVSDFEAWVSLAGPCRKGRPMFTYWPTKSSENSGQIGASAFHVNTGDVQQPDGTRRLSTDSPSNQVTPFSALMETEDPVRLAAPQPPLGNNPDSQTSLEPIQIRVGQNPDSHIYAITDTEEPQTSEQRPIDRSFKAVENTSTENLSSAAKDMQEELIQMDFQPFDAGLGDFELFLGDDDFTNFLNDVDFAENCELQPNKKLKGDVDSESKDVAMPLDDPNNLRSSLPLNNSSPKEPNHKLDDEIIEAHRVLFDTVIVTPSNLTNKHSDGTIVRCVYTPIAVSEEIKRLLPAEKQSVSLSLEILVPFNYPDVPPKILGSWLPEGCVGRIVQMTESTRAMFDEQVQDIEPLRVGEMAKLWDQCAKTVLLDYARLYGAQTQTFSSSSGEWELFLSEC